MADGIDYYEAQSIAAEAARNAKYDAVRESSEALDVETRNRRESEAEIRDGLGELAERIRRIEAALCTGARDEAGRLQHDGDTCPIHESDGPARSGLTSAQLAADVERYGHVAAWREED